MTILDPRHLGLWRQYATEAGLARARADVSAHRRALKARHAQYPDVPFPPPVFDARFMQQMVNTAGEILSMVVSIPYRVFGGDYQRWAEHLGIPSQEARFLCGFADSPRFRSMATAFARPDVLLTEDAGFKVVEVNVAPPIGGLGFCDELQEVFLDTAFARFLEARRLAVHAPRMGDVWGRVIKSLVRNRSAQTPLFFEAMAEHAPNLKAEFDRPSFLRTVTELGFEVMSGSMHEIEVGRDGAFARGRPVDVVFTCSTYLEMMQNGVPKELIERLAQADTSASVDLIAPPLSTLFDNKRNLEILTDPRFASLFSPRERAICKRHIARTVGLTAEARHLAEGDRQRWVLKPATDFGGRGVTVGQSLGDEAWRHALNSALTTGVEHVLQERVTSEWRCPGVDAEVADATEEDAGFSVCLGPTFFGTAYGGTLLRQMPYTGATRVINHAQGAQVGTAFTGQP